MSDNVNHKYRNEILNIMFTSYDFYKIQKKLSNKKKRHLMSEKNRKQLVNLNKIMLTYTTIQNTNNTLCCVSNAKGTMNAFSHVINHIDINSTEYIKFVLHNNIFTNLCLLIDENSRGEHSNKTCLNSLINTTNDTLN